MTRLLISEPAYQRLQPRLNALGQLDCVVMDKDEAVRLNGRRISPDDADVDCALLSHDLFFASFTKSYLALLMKSPTLKWVQSAGAGVDHSMFVTLAGKGIRMTTNHGQAVGIAEYVLWGVLNHFQGGKAHAAEQAAHRWTKQQSREVSGTRWLIIGYGSIGQEVARRAKAFDAHVTAVRRSPEQSPFADVMTTPEGMSEHIGDSDVVVLCVPHSPQTVELVDANFLAAMKPGSVLVNVGRGSVIKDDALLAALDAGKPEHAILDVFRVEPLPAESRYWDHPRVTLTAHTSSSSSGTPARSDALFLHNLERYLAGKTLLHEVSASEVLAASATRADSPSAILRSSR